MKSRRDSLFKNLQIKFRTDLINPEKSKRDNGTDRKYGVYRDRQNLVTFNTTIETTRTDKEQ
jgi:hypothetical protein